MSQFRVPWTTIPRATFVYCKSVRCVHHLFCSLIEIGNNVDNVYRIIVRPVLPDEITIRRSSGEMVTGRSALYMVQRNGQWWVPVKWWDDELGLLQKIVPWQAEYIQAQKISEPVFLQFM